MPDNLVTWFRAQLDEQQHRNEGTGIAAWLTYLDKGGGLLFIRLAASTELKPDRWTIDGDDAPEGWAHVNIVHDERAVRADIAAKRAILNLHEHHREPVFIRALNQRLLNDNGTLPGVWRCITCHPAGVRSPRRAWCQTLRQLAQPYGEQPGYRTEWRP
jgi:hypothetical protein